MAQAYAYRAQRRKVERAIIARAPTYVDYASIAKGEINWGNFDKTEHEKLADKGWIKGALKIVADKGFPHAVVAGKIEDFEVLFRLHRPVGRWTMVCDGAFAFEDDADAVAFRLIVNP